jgi:hypothetical protein
MPPEKGDNSFSGLAYIGREKGCSSEGGFGSQNPGEYKYNYFIKMPSQLIEILSTYDMPVLNVILIRPIAALSPGIYITHTILPIKPTTQMLSALQIAHSCITEAKFDSYPAQKIHGNLGRIFYSFFSAAFFILNSLTQSSAFDFGKTKILTTSSTASTFPVPKTFSRDTFFPIFNRPPLTVSM